MSKRSTVIYSFDGSFEGLLCCVFETYQQNEMPMDILPDTESLPLLLPVKAIMTDEEKARRVLVSIPKKMGKEALLFVRQAFLTCHPQKHLLILRFLRLGFKFGASVLSRLTNETVHALSAAVRHLCNEAHLYKGFVRFSEANGVLTACIEPKNIVLPLIAQHFCERFGGERFLIHDKTHDMALIYQESKWTITSAENLMLPAADDEEYTFRALWKLFYDTIEIKERHNSRCRMGHMPKRYWSYMTEFSNSDQTGLLLLPAEER